MEMYMSLTLAGATAIGAGLSFLGGLAANKVNKDVADQNIDFQNSANAQNLALTREMNERNIAFQQQENAIIRSREDNAVQRAAADMQAAGFSKTLAAGNPASAAALSAPSVKSGSVNAVNNQFKYESALQKMNLGSLLLDMASKQQQLDINKGVADAQIANIKADTAGKELSNSTFMEEFNLNKEFKFAQTAYQYAQTAKSEAETDLVKIEGKYAAQKITSQINLLIAQRVKTNAEANVAVKNIDYVSQQIAESVARTYNLDLTGQELAYKITYAQLQNNALEHNLGVAQKYGYPTGVWPTNILGYTDRMAHGSIDSLFGSGSFYFGLPSIINTLTDENNKMITNPAKARKFFNFFNFGL